PALAQPGGDGGPPRIVWAAHKDTPYTGVNKPVTHVADILKKHAGKQSWDDSGQVKITIDGQQPVTATKGYLFDVAPRLSYCMENTGTEPVVFYRSTPAGQVPSYPESETRTPVPGYHHDKARLTSGGWYGRCNQPLLDFSDDAAKGGKSRDFALD